MKKIFFYAFALFWSLAIGLVGPVRAQSGITLLSPANGVNFSVGTTMTINWAYQARGGNLDVFTVELLLGNEVYRTIATSVAPANIPVAFQLTNELPVRNDYRIRVSRTNSPTDNVQTTAFTIGGGRTLALTTLNGGENLTKGQNAVINWNSNAPGNVRIELLRNGNPVQTIAEAAPGSSFTWLVPTSLADGGGYRLRLTNGNDRFLTTTSANDFSIGRVLAVTAPVGGEVWLRGAARNITWTSNVAENVRIELRRAGNLFRTLNASTAGTPAGTFAWTIPNDIPDGTNYRIRVVNTVDTLATATNPADFTIGNFLTFRNPAPGESAFRGTNFNIRWDTNLTGNGRVEVIRAGAVVAQLADNFLLSVGALGWAVPNNLPEATNYRIRITAAAPSTLVSESTEFAITSPLLSLVTPNGGELWNKGRVHRITWITNFGGDVRIDLIVNNAVAQNIVPSTPNNGGFDWTIPTNLANASTYRVRLTGIGGITITGESAANFTIGDAPTISILAPNGGESLPRNGNFNLRWQSNFSDNVRVELLRGGNVVLTPFSNIVNTNSVQWAVPNDLPLGNNYRIRVTNTVLSNVSAQSAGDFTIGLADSIVVAAPNGGERLARGSNVDIRWRTSLTSENVVIELLQNNAVVGGPIATVAANAGTFRWLVPNNVGTGENGYRIRIRTADSRVVGQSSNPFSLIEGIFRINVPAGGETWFLGLTNTVTWTTNLDGAVRLELLRGGATVQTLVASTTASQFDWAVPSSLTPAADYRLRLTSLVDNNRTALSGTFTLATPELRVTAPNGNESLLGNGFRTNITWVNNTGRPVLLELLRGTEVVQAIANNQTGTSFEWTPPDLPDGTNYSVRVSIVGSPAINDVSDAAFTIVRPSIRVVAPNGGENVVRDLTFNISWQSNLGNQLVRILLLNSQGAVIQDITPGGGLTANQSPWGWIVISSRFPTGTNFRIRIIAVNNDRVFGESASGFNIINDNVPPVISNLVQPRLLEINQTVQSLTTSATITDNVRLANVQVFFRPITAAASVGFTARPTESQGNVYSASLPSTLFDELGLEYYLEATDAAGNVSRTPRVAANLRYTSPQGLLIPNFRLGSAVEDYQIVAVPLTLDNPDALAVFRDEFNDYDPKNWRLFRYENQGNQEFNAEGFTNIELGRGYWLIAQPGALADPNQGPTINISTGTGSGPVVSPAQPFTLNLNQGWNLIGNPYRFNVQWNDVRTANNNSLSFGNLRTFNGAGFSDAARLAPFRGGFVFADGPVAVRVPVAKCATCRLEEEAPEALVNPLHARDWEVRFDLTVGHRRHQLSGLGMRSTASASKDEHDDMTLPRFMKYLEINFMHPEYFHPKFAKDVVPTADNHIWDFTVESNNDEKRSTLRWDNSYFGNARQLRLLDLELQRVIDMNQVNEYVFNNSAGKHRFRVFFGDPEFIARTVQPDEVALQAYPNPVGNRTQLAFALPPDWHQAQANLRVYNSLGQTVGVLTDGPLAAGFHQLGWQPANLPTGTYFCVLQLAHEGRTLRKTVKLVVE
ncbi:MAG: hypothetical protein MUC97_05365 [Bernardetiaceae bacterium]|nr:hypothetical protein [Bernardetiaceae bacterium]